MMTHLGIGHGETLTLPARPRERELRATTSPRIHRDEIVVVTKASRFARELAATQSSEEELSARYRAQGESGARILAGHLHQEDSIARCRAELGARRVVSLDSFRELNPATAKVVIALGGDDFFKLVSHSLREDQMILGVNSDPSMSRGALLPVTIEELSQAIAALERGDYRLEPWTRAKLVINGEVVGPATDSIVLGKRDFRLTSRHELEIRGERATHRSSGLLISTGVGSTGWFLGAGLYLGSEDRTFPKTAPYLRYELREPAVTFEEGTHGRQMKLPPLCEGMVNPGETLRITSLNDEDGIASRDSLDQNPFPRGAVAEISVDPIPLNVIIPGGK